MAGDEQRHQLVAQLLRRHRRFVLVARVEQQAEDVVALGLLAPSLVDQLEQQLVGLLLQAQEAGEWAVSLEHRLRGARGAGASRLIGRSPKASIADRRSRSSVEAFARIEAEDRPQDDLHRQALKARPELDRLSARPTRDLPLGHLRDQVAEALHLLAVEGGKHQLALLQVRALIQQDDRVRPDDGLEHPSSLAGVKNVGRRREDLLDLVRVGDHHEGRRQRQANREPLAVAGAAALQEAQAAASRSRCSGSRTDMTDPGDP